MASVKEKGKAQTKTAGHSVSKVVVTNAKFKCTNCGKWKPASKFGFRKVENAYGTTVRNQSQCTDCRS